MEKICQVCGATFHGRSDAKSCSAACREKARRRRIAQSGTTAAPAAIPAQVVSLPVPAPDQPPKPLVVAIEKQLGRAERLDTPAGQMALVLAQRLAAGLDTGSALATLSRELTARMAEALAGATVEPDALDELAARRERKAASA